jgi:hypothetical protein
MLFGSGLRSMWSYVRRSLRSFRWPCYIYDVVLDVLDFVL